MCQKTGFKKQHPSSEKCTCFDDTDEDQESLKIMDCCIKVGYTVKVKQDAEKTLHLYLIAILIIVCDTMLILFFSSTWKDKTGP